MRVVLATFAVLAFALVAVSAVEEAAPVPVGMSLPTIYNSVMDREEGRKDAKTLVNLVAKEPTVAYGVGGPEAAVEDMWNGENDPVSSANVEQLKMLREVDQLTKLIGQGKKILKVLPRKEKRLSLLKLKLSKILDGKAKQEAQEKLAEQQALLAAIKKRETAMSTRMSKLNTSQKKLEDSVEKLQAVIAAPVPGSQVGLPQVGGVAGGAKSNDKAQKRSFMELDAEADIAADMEDQQELESEETAEEEMNFDAEQQE